jgi:predicted ester cyclase
MGIHPTNKKVMIQRISISHRNAEGEIIEEWEKYDTAGALRQLGLAH